MKWRRWVVNTFASLAASRRLARSIQWEVERRESVEACGHVAPHSRVLRGPFQGMLYPLLSSAGSALFPKLLGSYEDEVHPALVAALDKRPLHVVNVGCGEGYYAVGLARALPEAQIHAFDVDSHAVTLCSAMAEANGVQSRVSVHRADPQADACAGWPMTPGLVVCDCEGCEEVLFRPSQMKRLAKSCILIEIHDDAVGRRIAHDFLETHEVSWVYSVIKQLDSYPEARKLPETLYKDSLLTERTRRQPWLVMVPRDRPAD